MAESVLNRGLFVLYPSECAGQVQAQGRQAYGSELTWGAAVLHGAALAINAFLQQHMLCRAEHAAADGY